MYTPLTRHLFHTGMIVFASLFLGAASVSAGNTPTITATTTNLTVSPNTITITGSGFGAAAPIVMLDELPLQVASNTDSVIVAFLPNNLAPDHTLSQLRTAPHPRRALSSLRPSERSPAA
jgi:hypothetical protein